MTADFRPAPPISPQTWQTFEVPEGYRAEIIRGELVVAPAPGIGHQHVVIRFGHLLDVAAPDGYLATAAVEWERDASDAVTMALQPDILVVERSAERLDRAPLLAIEILSPSDFHRLDRSDLTRIEGKRLDYAANGLADYVEVDLTGTEPTLRRYALVDGVLVLGDTVSGADTLDATRPFPYSVRPVDLVP